MSLSMRFVLPARIIGSQGFESCSNWEQYIRPFVTRNPNSERHDMMVKIFLLAILLLLPSLALAQQSGTYRDKYGNTVGSWSDNGNQRTYRDSHGNTEGTSTRDGDRRDYRDREGNYVGSRDETRRGR